MQPQTQFVTWPFVQQQLMLTPVHTALLPRLAKSALPATIASASCVSCDTLSAKSPATGNPCSFTDTVARNPLTAAVVISQGTEASSTSQEGFVDLDHWQSREPKKPATPPRQEVRYGELFRRPPSLRPKHREEFEPENKRKVTRVQLLSVQFQGETREVLAGVGGRVAQERSGRNRRKEARDREGMEQEDSHQQSETNLGRDWVFFAPTSGAANKVSRRATAIALISTAFRQPSSPAQRSATSPFARWRTPRT